MNLKFFELALNSSFKDIRWEFIKEGFLREKIRQHALDQVKSKIQEKKKENTFRPRKKGRFKKQLQTQK